MGMHDYHDALPGFDPAAIWHDGCGECEYRGEQSFDVQLGYLDLSTFQRACERARAWEEPTRPGAQMAHPNAAEASLLRGIYAFLRKLDDIGTVLSR